MQAGDLGVWDPTAAHRGWSVDGAAWEARLLLVERPTFAELAKDPDGCCLDLEFPDPMVTDPTQARSFLRLHHTLESSKSGFERESVFADWLQQLTMLAPARSRRHRESRSAARRHPALRRACERLHDELTTEIPLAALAAEAGTSKYQLIRLFKAGLGLPPHAYLIQLRVQKARTLLEAGHSPTEVADLAGFCDQSHLNRHFTRRIGLTPAGYARAVRGA